MKLTVSNFQIHQKPTSVDIPEGETTYLEGDSDTGKSSKLRAMRWLCENKPDGGSFVTFKQPRGTNSMVRLEVDGRTVERERGKSKNAYRMDDETFEAFGRSVPEPIAKFLCLSPYAFQCQGEAPFLIGASPTDAAKILSDACGLGVIDTAVQFVRGKKTVVEADIRKSEILLESAQQRLSQTTEQLPLAAALETAAGLGEEVQGLSDTAQNLEHAIVDEPEGKMLDVEGVRLSAAAARATLAMAKELMQQDAALTCAIHAEPVGTMFDLAALRKTVDAAHSCSVSVNGLIAKTKPLRYFLDNEPVDTPFDLKAAQMIAGQARVIGGWLKDVMASRDRIRLVLSTEPQGKVRDVSDAARIATKAGALGDDRSMLELMCANLRRGLQSEPQGVLMSTTELQQQRAQIKVCPTCLREL